MNQEKKLVVIGGGMTGLATALTWALHHDITREPVVVLENQPKSGGFVTSYERKGFVFDTCQMIPDLTELFKFFDIDIPLKRFQGYFMRLILANPQRGSAKIIELPPGVVGFKNYLMDRYPHNARQIKFFLDYSREMYQELFHLKMEPTVPELVKTIIHCPKIVRNASKTFSEYYKKFGITDPEVAEIFNAFAEFCALPPDQVAAIVPVSALFSLLDGAYRTKGPFMDLPKALEDKYIGLGGELRLNTEVEKILIDNGKTVGVRLKNGEIIKASHVVTTVDPIFAMKELVGFDVIREQKESYVRKIESVRMSTSSMNVSLGLDDSIDLDALGLDCGYNVVTTGGNTYDLLFKLYQNNMIGFSDTRFHLGVICPSLTTGRKPNITIRITPMALSNWGLLRQNHRNKYKEEKQKWADLFIDIVEKYLIPDLRKHILVTDVSTPATYARYNGSPSGSIYDMAPSPDNFGLRRLPMRTPIEGLFQPKFVHGVFGSLLAGIQVNDMIEHRKIMDGNARLPKN